ncbi:MAG: glucose-1-phosphate cytidylyltransferase [Candidatus Sericytochromatia bacterium]
MKVVILAGGLGTRLSEETELKPKPMVTIGGQPILWHILKYYSSFGFTEFVLATGYKGYMIKEYFANYFLHMSDVTFDLANNRMEIHRQYAEPWRVTLVDTGLETMTGGRIKRVADYVGRETFLMTYGDGLSDVDLNALVAAHRERGNTVTVTAVQPAGRFGALSLTDAGRVDAFQEKPAGDGGWVNGGYFVMEPAIFDVIEGDTTYLEREPLETLAREGRLGAYKHHGFWHSMDTLRDKNNLEALWNSDQAPWRVWDRPRAERP